MSKEDKFRQFSVRVPTDLADYIDAQAKKRHRSKNQQVSYIVEQYRQAQDRPKPVTQIELDHLTSQINAQLLSVVAEAVRVQLALEARRQAEAVRSQLASEARRPTKKIEHRINCRMPLYLIDEIDRLAEEAGVSRRIQLERIVRQACGFTVKKIAKGLYKSPGKAAVKP